MEDAVAATSEASVRRSKRNRTGKLYREVSDQSPNDPGRDDSFDDVEEVRPKAKRNRAVEPANNVNFDQISLIEAIKGSRKNIPPIVKVWVELYEKDKKQAMLDLLSMLFESCGAKYDMEGDPFEEIDVDNVVIALVNLATKGEVEDYQSSKRKDFNNMKDNLVYFWDNLVTECQIGPLFDGMLFDKCTDYVIALSCTPPRIYRQVASLVGLQLVTSFITVAKMLGSQRETTQRQLNAENKKRAEGPRAQSLNKRLMSTHEKITIIEEMMDKIFKGLFMHRYRDIDPNIRVSSIQSLGVWILSYPSLFLQDRYLKYLGWTLNDKNAGVRKASVVALQSLYEVDDNVPSLDLFTQRFSNRMIELADDIDISVAVSAIGLLKQLLRHQLLLDDHLGPLYDLLVVEAPEIRRAIGELVYDHLIEQKFNTSQPQSADSDSSLVTLGRMLQILKEFSRDPLLITYVIDDVWEYMKAMKDWKCIISVLLDENPSIELTEIDATNLIRLLCASVKKAVGERIVPVTDNRKQYYTKAQKEVFETNKQEITVVMMKNYPQLLRKYVADNAKAPSLVQIVQYMNLELYSLKRQEQNFKTVLQLMKEAFFKHGDKETLRSCIQAMHFCCVECKGELQEFANNKLKEVEDELMEKLKAAVKEAMDGDDEYPILVNLKRLYELQLWRSVPIDNLFDDFSSMLENFRNVDDEVNCFLLLNMFLHIKWCLHSVVSSETVNDATVSYLLSKRDTLFKKLDYILLPSQVGVEMKLGNQLACRVCVILAELWCLFRKLKYSSTALDVLGLYPPQATLEKFWKLCEQQLDVSSETEDEDLNREYVEETTRDVVIIAAGKLITSNVVPLEYLGPEIISHLTLHGNNIAEVIKQLIAVLRKKDENVFLLYLEALKRAYHRHMLQRSNDTDKLSVDNSFLDCKQLAVQLSGTIVGAARSKHRLDILKMVKAAIDYAFIDAPQRLSFLVGAVVPFVEKLPSTDIPDLLKDIQGRTENTNTDEDPSGWRPYHQFVETLQEKCVKMEGFAGAEDKEATAMKRRGRRPPKQRNLRGKKLFDEKSSSGEDDAISSSDQEAPDDEDEQDEENTTLIDVIKSSSKLRSKKLSRPENRGQNPV
ncbi:sister-chromatid cohesion protein 3 isoform X2 [Amaranthus tricolor]|uniref:sister-chromatid cohesion protein 3 isoform X2 n=1 Tax=Amaranthus tricolor TaxID=29722 RepID=UPI002590FB81|nr:sister-chromatid cohesion protein 3 isoform X2 [Amaranthus tricolor]